MSISAIGNTYTYVYNTETKKLSTANGTEDDFVKYYNGEIEGSESETLNGFDVQRKGDFERILMLIEWGKLGHNQIGDDTEIEISGTIVDGDTTEYTINDEAVFTAYVAPSFTYSEYQEISDIWASGEDYACTNDNNYPYPDSVYNKVLQRYEEWLYQPLSARLKTSDIGSATRETNNAGKILEDKINELFVKIQNGDTEVTFQIGAQTFTEEEWKEFLNNEIDMDGFVESVYSKEELLQAVDKEVQSNQHKKKSLYEMLRDSSIEGTNAKFSFVGESKIYSFNEFIEEFERRFQANLELS